MFQWVQVEWEFLLILSDQCKEPDFFFIFGGRGYMGCRDWMWVHQLAFAAYSMDFANEWLPEPNIYVCLSMAVWWIQYHQTRQYTGSCATDSWKMAVRSLKPLREVVSVFTSGELSQLLSTPSSIVTDHCICVGFRNGNLWRQPFVPRKPIPPSQQYQSQRVLILQVPSIQWHRLRNGETLGHSAAPLAALGIHHNPPVE